MHVVQGFARYIKPASNPIRTEHAAWLALADPAATAERDANRDAWAALAVHCLRKATDFVATPAE